MTNSLKYWSSYSQNFKIFCAGIHLKIADLLDKNYSIANKSLLKPMDSGNIK